MIDTTEAHSLKCLTDITPSNRYFIEVDIVCKGRDAGMCMLSFQYLGKENCGKSLIQFNAICPIT